MRQMTTATYQDGVLKPDRALAIADRQQVLVIVLPLPPARPDPARVARMEQQAALWLSRQPVGALRPPLERAAAGDNGSQSALADIRARAGQWSEAEILADVEAALSEVEMLSPDERARLDDELSAALAGWSAHGG